MTKLNTTPFEVRRITTGSQYYFKAYYDIQPWSADGRYFLCMRSDFQDRPPLAADLLTLGMVDLTSDIFLPLAKTYAWNFQQGCMPHWMPRKPSREIIFNDRAEGKFCSWVMDIETKEKRQLPLPIQALTSDGRWGASLNYARWGEHRPGYGYAGVTDVYHGQAEPLNDAVELMDLDSGATSTLLTYGALAALTSDLDGRKGSPMHLCHLMFNPDGSRLAGIARWWSPHLAHNVYGVKLNVDGAVPERRHCLWAVDSDGNNLQIVVNDGLVSHTEWLDNDRILAWANTRYDQPPGYLLFDLKDQSVTVLGRDLLTCDGHMSYHPFHKEWLLTDTYPDETYRRVLKLYNTEQDREVELGRFLAPPELQGELRCDLHPTWSQAGDKVAIDSIHEGGRRNVYVVHVGDVKNL